jgi:ribosomal protein L37AE/L43A
MKTPSAAVLLQTLHCPACLTTRVIPDSVDGPWRCAICRRVVDDARTRDGGDDGTAR